MPLPVNKKLKIEFSKDVKNALEYWSKAFISMFDTRYGKGKIGHIILVFPLGNDSNASWISNADRRSVIELSEKTASHLRKNEPKIILPSDA